MSALTNSPVQDDRIFFKPVQKAVPPKYDSSKPEKLEVGALISYPPLHPTIPHPTIPHITPHPLAQVFIDTIKTFQYQDRITFTCKVPCTLGYTALWALATSGHLIH